MPSTGKLLANMQRSAPKRSIAWWTHGAIERFGADRCMFASNFPVVGMHGSFDDLYGAYDQLTADLDEATRDQLFAGNAERVYGC